MRRISVTIKGTCGVGKTALLNFIQAKLEEAYPDVKLTKDLDDCCVYDQQRYDQILTGSPLEIYLQTKGPYDDNDE